MSKKILYVDRPFIGLNGGDKNRSRFIYESLSNSYSVKLVTILTDENIENFKNSSDLLLSAKSSNIFQTKAVYSFSDDEIKKFKSFIETEKVDTIFFRFCSMANLANAIDLDSVKIIVDVDMLFSRISKQAWLGNISFKNRYYFFEYIKQTIFERFFLNKSFLYLFTNQIELDSVRKYNRNINSQYEVLPNVMQKIEVENSENIFNENYIIFYGMLNSTANIDSYKFLIDEIYPRIESILREKNHTIYIVGRGKSDIYRDLDYLKIIGDVDNISLAIAQSQFVFLPLRVGSGTRTRILEAAFVKKAVLTTTIGAEGLDFDENEIVIANSIDDIVKEFLALMESKENQDRLGKNLYSKAIENYLDENVEKKLIKLIDEY